MGLAERFIKEPGTEDAQHYRVRVTQLTCCYAALFAASLVGIALLVWQAQLYVTLAQRSNVETLTLAFFLVFFTYLAALSAPGARGAARIAWFRWRPARGLDDPIERERSKARALGSPSRDTSTIDTNVLIELEESPGEPFEIPVCDSAGGMGRIRVDGARIAHIAEHGGSSSDVLGYFVEQVGRVLRDRGTWRDVEIVTWKRVDNEDAERYHGMVEFARNLQRQLGGAPLWPAVQLTKADFGELEKRLSAICPALRDEGFLPQWEFSGEHKVPVIPEPLGLISLSRNEVRVDPVSSMGCALIVVLAAVGILALFVVAPPWVPGK